MPLLRRSPSLSGVCRDLALTVLGCTFTLLLLFQPFRVEGNSMLPSIEDRERILVNKIIYEFTDIKQGDVIVFRYPLDPRKSFIKRVIGVPGDTVEVRGGQVWVNGILLQEKYLRRDLCGRDRFGPQVVASDSFFVLGDYRRVSNDSRDWGLVPRSSIYGKAVLRYWPPAHLGLVH